MIVFVEGCKKDKKTRTLTSGGISNAICNEAPPMSSDPAVFTPRGVELPPEATEGEAKEIWFH